jgi:hypothetical protein
VLRVKYASEFSSFEEFADYIKALPVVFDREKREVTFDGIHLTRNSNFVNGQKNLYPYPATYDSPIMYSEWGSGRIEIKCEGESTVYDFNE